jgi:uncharacterized protein
MTTAASAAGLYAGMLILMGIYLQFRVIKLRRTKLIGIGDGKDHDLARAIRVHGNFVENVSIGIGGLVLLAVTAAPVLIVHAVGMLMVAGRAAHAVGLTQSAGSSPGRVGGMMITFTALIVTAVTLIVRAFM